MQLKLNLFAQLSQWWLENAYLGYRLPIVVHSNPALVFPKQNFQSQTDQIAYAAKLIVGALRFKSIIDEFVLFLFFFYFAI